MSEEVEYWNHTGITSGQLADEVWRLGQEQPDYVYPKENGACKYTHRDQTPGCIVGMAIFNLTGKLVDQNANGGGMWTPKWHDRLGEDYDHPTTAYNFLKYAQSGQDDANSWGKAVSEARQEACWDPTV